MAILYGPTFAKEKELFSIVVEIDSSLAVSEMSKNSCSFCTWGNIISDICRSTAECEDCSFRHVKRGVNSFANNIARLDDVADVNRFWWRELAHISVIRA